LLSSYPTKPSSDFTGLASGMARMYVMLNEQADKPAWRGNIAAHTGDAALDNGFFAEVTACYTAEESQKRIGKQGDHGSKHLLTEEI